LFTLLSSVFSLGGEGHGEIHGDMDAEAETPLDMGHGDVEADHGEGFLDFLGVGKVPLSVLLGCASVLWGATGLVGNILLGYSAIWVTLGASFCVTFFGTGLVARLVARLIPSVATYYTTPFELWGETGTALYSITEKGGTVRTRDKYNHLLDLECRVPPGEAAIEAGETVMLDDYDPQRNIYYVRKAHLVQNER
jgi:membrane protein implicated in regulation of membrane protease activity